MLTLLGMFKGHSGIPLYRHSYSNPIKQVKDFFLIKTNVLNKDRCQEESKSIVGRVTQNEPLNIRKNVNVR